MLEWLNGVENEKGSPNENYGREMMELFTLGADRGAYTERDVREQARALTGWQNRWKRGVGSYDFHFDAARHDTGMKRVFGKTGNFDWRDACNLCLSHHLHPSFFVQKLWSYFVPTKPDHGTQSALEAVYKNGYEIKPVVSAILSHPALYTGPRLMKPPIVHTAGLLRRLGMGDHDDRLGLDRRPLRAAALLPAERRRLGRHALARHGDLPRPLVRGAADAARQVARPAEGEGAVRREAARVARARLLERPAPVDRHAGRAARASPSTRSPTPAAPTGSSSSTRCSSQNALRQLVAMSPDLQTA